MELLNNYRQFIFILIITVVLGYFLGIAVSTVVDYRLKDAVINFPKQKSKVIVKLEKDVKTNKISKNKKKHNKKRFPEMKRVNIETFKSSPDDISDNLTNVPNNLKKTWQYDVDNYDPNLQAYAKLNKQAVTTTEKDLNSGNYDQKTKKVIKQDTINNLSAYNQEMSNELYQEIQKTGEYRDYDNKNLDLENTYSKNKINEIESKNKTKTLSKKTNEKLKKAKNSLSKKLRQIKADLVVLENKTN